MSSKFRIVCSFATQRFHLSRWSLSFCLRYKKNYTEGDGALYLFPPWSFESVTRRRSVTLPHTTIRYFPVNVLQNHRWCISHRRWRRRIGKQMKAPLSRGWRRRGGPPDLRNALPPTCRSYLVSAEARIDRNRRPLPWTRKVHAADIDNDVISDSDVGSP